jgi:hypothetical protein
MPCFGVVSYYLCDCISMQMFFDILINRDYSHTFEIQKNREAENYMEQSRLKS